MSRLPGIPLQLGRYRILKELGTGGMGTVYLAEDGRLDCLVALKVPHFPQEDQPKAVARFQREARLAQSLQHPYLCPVYEVGEINGAHFLTMPHIEGTPLNQLIGPK